jgi:hypothetical protein
LSSHRSRPTRNSRAHRRLLHEKELLSRIAAAAAAATLGIMLRGHCSFMAAERTIDAVITEDGDLVRTNQANARFGGGGGGGGARNA